MSNTDFCFGFLNSSKTGFDGDQRISFESYGENGLDFDVDEPSESVTNVQNSST